jgi:glycosyltransferase involved in cell wall biosynthesis
MRIGIDARMYGSAQGGLGRYIEQLLIHLEQQLTDEEIVVFLRRDNFDAYTPTHKNITKVLADIPWYGWREQLLFPTIIAKAKIDIMHFPHWNVPLYYNKPFVVTIHDLLLLHFPTREASTLGPITYTFKNWIFKRVLRHAATASRLIIAPSDYTKQDIVKTLAIAEKKIYVTRQAATIFTKTTPKPLAHHGITKPFVLYVGVSYPHKNLEGLLTAWALFEKKYGTDYQLVLVGKENFFYRRLLKSATARACQGLVYTNFVPDEELPTLYQKSRLYVLPSLYEGYALPALEAMAYGLPVASSNATCLPEVLQDGALYFDPKNTNSIVSALFQGLTDEPARQKLQERGTRIVTNYQARDLAQKTLTLYHQAVDNRTL